MCGPAKNAIDTAASGSFFEVLKSRDTLEEEMVMSFSGRMEGKKGTLLFERDRKLDGHQNQ